MEKEGNLGRGGFKEEDRIKREDPVINFIAFLLAVIICFAEIFFEKIFGNERR